MDPTTATASATLTLPQEPAAQPSADTTNKKEAADASPPTTIPTPLLKLLAHAPLSELKEALAQAPVTNAKELWAHGAGLTVPELAPTNLSDYQRALEYRALTHKGLEPEALELVNPLLGIEHLQFNRLSPEAGVTVAATLRHYLTNLHKLTRTERSLLLRALRSFDPSSCCR